MRKPDGTTYVASLQRSIAYGSPVPAKAWKILDGNIGYVDLRFLESSDVDTMIAEMQGTRGLIIDIRGYPRGVFPRLGPRLNTGSSTKVAQFRTSLLTGGTRSTESFTQELGRSTLQPYRGKTVTLVNERAVSQSEHTCLVLEALNKTTFVGTPSVGANGDITLMTMPGGISITFTGDDVRHLDGRQLQRVGIVPDVEVPRTIAAAAAHRDEVLERAVAIINEQ